MLKAKQEPEKVCQQNCNVYTCYHCGELLCRSQKNKGTKTNEKQTRNRKCSKCGKTGPLQAACKRKANESESKQKKIRIQKNKHSNRRIRRRERQIKHGNRTIRNGFRRKLIRNKANRQIKTILNTEKHKAFQIKRLS